MGVASQRIPENSRHSQQNLELCCPEHSWENQLATFGYLLVLFCAKQMSSIEDWACNYLVASLFILDLLHCAPKSICQIQFVHKMEAGQKIVAITRHILTLERVLYLDMCYIRTSLTFGQVLHLTSVTFGQMLHIWTSVTHLDKCHAWTCSDALKWKSGIPACADTLGWRWLSNWALQESNLRFPAQRSHWNVQGRSAQSMDETRMQCITLRPENCPGPVLQFPSVCTTSWNWSMKALLRLDCPDCPPVVI